MTTIDDPQLMIRLLHFLSAPATAIHSQHNHTTAHGHRLSEGQPAPDFANFIDQPPESLDISLSCSDAPPLEARLANPADAAAKPRSEAVAASRVKPQPVRVAQAGKEKGWTGGPPEPFIPRPVPAGAAPASPLEPSGVTKIRQSCPPFLIRNNAFSVFANLCGDGASSAESLRLNIYLPFATNPREREMPMEICILNKATVRETIGYILYQYSALGRQPAVKEQVTAYELRMTEDNGEPDVDLPPLDLTQRIAKFEFDALCLCQTKNFTEVPVTPELRFLRILYERSQSSIISRSDKKCGSTVGEVLQEIARRRVLRGNVDYVIELESEPGVALAPDTTLAALDARLGDPRTIFLRILRKFHKRGTSSDPACASGPAFDSTLRLFSQQTFSVVRPQRFGNGVAIDLCIDMDRVEMRPFGRGGPFSRSRPVVVINVHQLIKCEVVDDKPLLRLHASTDAETDKVYELEARSHDEAVKICSKIDAIILARASRSA